MAISVSFNGSTIYKSGSYSKTTIDLGGGFPLSPTGIVAIIGEADAGAPADLESDIKNNVFGPDQLSSIRDKYKSGPIVDAASFVFSPASDGNIPAGAQALYILKTNSSVQASLALANNYSHIYSQEYGLGGNLITFKNVMGAETLPTVTGATISNFGAALNGVTFKIMVDGVIDTITLSGTPADHAAIGSLVIELNALMVAASCPVTVTNTADKLIFTRSARSNPHRLGYGSTMELVDSTPGDLIKLGLVAAITNSTLENKATFTVDNMRDQIVETDINGGSIVLEIGYSDLTATSANVTIDASNITLTSVGGLTPGAKVLSIASFRSLKALSDYINTIANWKARVPSAGMYSYTLQRLDRVTSVGALSNGNYATRIKMDAFEVRDFFSQSINIFSNPSISDSPYCGLPDAVATATALTGGVKGGTLDSDIVTALDKIGKFRVNAVIPLFSRDATADITDSLTDAASTYTIAAIHQNVKNHLSLMQTTKKRSERQGYLSFKDTYVNCKTQAGVLSDARSQLFIQDIKQTNGFGDIMWFQPWALACLAAGARMGSPIGLPLTFKFLNCSGIRQTAQAMTTSELNIVQDFDPDLQYEDAIQSGITFLENPQTGGFRVVVDNTTYGIDANWVYNRGNVLYAADVLAYDFRNQMEAIYVGQKNNASVNEIKSTAESILIGYVGQGITVSTPDAPNGFKSLLVKLEGNIIRISFTVKLVEGIDYVLNEITLQRATATA